MDINTFDNNNWFINCIHLNLESIFALVISIFMIILCFLIQLNEWILNDDLYKYYHSYYKVIWCFWFIFIALTMIILWIQMIRLTIIESIKFAETYLLSINDTDNLAKDMDNILIQ